MPPSVNHSYHPISVNGHLRMRKDASVSVYQDTVALLTRLARPSTFRPIGQIRVFYDFYLRTRIDCDNAVKALNDAIAVAIGVDDGRFLPCTRSKTVDKSISNPRVEVEVVG